MPIDECAQGRAWSAPIAPAATASSRSIWLYMRYFSLWPQPKGGVLLCQYTKTVCGRRRGYRGDGPCAGRSGQIIGSGSASDRFRGRAKHRRRRRGSSLSPARPENRWRGQSGLRRGTDDQPVVPSVRCNAAVRWSRARPYPVIAAVICERRRGHGRNQQCRCSQLSTVVRNTILLNFRLKLAEPAARCESG